MNSVLITPGNIAEQNFPGTHGDGLGVGDFFARMTFTLTTDLDPLKKVRNVPCAQRHPSADGAKHKKTMKVIRPKSEQNILVCRLQAVGGQDRTGDVQISLAISPLVKGQI